MKRTHARLAIVLTAGALSSATAHAEGAPQSAMMTAIAAGQTVEARIEADMNGDGTADTAIVSTNAGNRTVHVLFSTPKGPVTAGRFRLRSDPIGPAELAVDKGVLIIKDLTGGTSALSATYRFQGDAATSKMRLIGLDSKFYSRTYAHDGREMSWNLLTGDIISSQLKQPTDPNVAAYDKVGTRRARRPVTTLYMEDTPDPNDELRGIAPAL